MKDKNANRRIGQAGVMRVKAELMLRGFDVAEPDVDCGVDLIAWDHRGISRIQVKATVQKDGDRGARFHTTKLVQKSEKSRQTYDPKEVDFLVCVSIPLNQFWIIPSKDTHGKVKIYMTIGNDYHAKWHYLSQSNSGLCGDKFASRRELTLKLSTLRKESDRLKRFARKVELERELLRHENRNFIRFLIRDGYSYKKIQHIERYATIHERKDWDHELGHQEAYQLECNISSLESLHEQLYGAKNNPANGAQGDPAAGCPPSVYAS